MDAELHCLDGLVWLQVVQLGGTHVHLDMLPGHTRYRQHGGEEGEGGQERDISL